MQIELLGAALDQFKLRRRACTPTPRKGLRALQQSPGSCARLGRGRTSKKDIPWDPWGSPYQYRGPRRAWRSTISSSLGSDGAAGGDGEARDVTSWGEARPERRCRRWARRARRHPLELVVVLAVLAVVRRFACRRSAGAARRPSSRQSAGRVARSLLRSRLQAVTHRAATGSCPRGQATAAPPSTWDGTAEPLRRG